MEQRYLQSLLKPSAYPEPTSSVELIQTHVSYIFLTDRFAYKVKKPVDFGFLNFSTIDRRRFYCNEEVRLNRRLCPDIYLGVVEVRETTDGAAFSGNGRVIDHAVKMRRLPAGRMLDRLLREGMVSGKEVRDIARVIGEFHLRADRSPLIDRYGSIETIRGNWEENFRQARPFVGITLSERDLRFIEDWVHGILKDTPDIFSRRIREGFIRDCDGDIHMENICILEDGRVCIFDCIEFNERFRYGDTASDIAFLLMDFDINRRPELCATFMDEYLSTTGDTGAAEVIDFYKVYRAFIRGKVESMRLLDSQIPPDDASRGAERARRYFRLARGYIARRAMSPSLILTCGLTGTGKSFFARELALELGVEIACSDVVRKELMGIPPTEHRRDLYGEGIYSGETSALTYRTLLDLAKRALTERRSIIVDATFRKQSDRQRFRELAESFGAPFHLIHFTCPEETVRQRLEARQTMPGEPSDGRWEIYLRQKEEFEIPAPDEPGIVRVDTSRSIEEVIDKIIEAMGIVPCG